MTDKVIEFNTLLFNLKKSSTWVVEWHPHVEDALKQPRYRSWFSAIDLVRLNVQTSLNVLCTKDISLNEILTVEYKSLLADVQINHAANQCFRELGLL